MEHFSNWVMGFFSVVMGVCGLFVASHAGYGVGYFGGIAIFVFAIFFVFYLVKTSLDHEIEQS